MHVSKTLTITLYLKVLLFIILNVKYNKVLYMSIAVIIVQNYVWSIVIGVNLSNKLYYYSSYIYLKFEK